MSLMSGLARMLRYVCMHGYMGDGPNNLSRAAICIPCIYGWVGVCGGGMDALNIRKDNIIMLHHML